MLRLNHLQVVKMLLETIESKSIKKSLFMAFLGMDRTYQRSDLGKYGFACKIVPEFSEKTQKTFKGCLHRQGTKQFGIKPQSIIPSFDFFTVRIVVLIADFKVFKAF